MDNLEMK
jgi:hypothetical protein